MSEQVFILRVENARELMVSVWRLACQFLELGKAVRVTVKEHRASRSLEQNSLFHCYCGQIARQRQWAGGWIDTEGWKRLIIHAWAKESGKKEGRVVPSLDGSSTINLSVQSHRMTVGEMAEVITFTQAWAAMNGVKLNDRASKRLERMVQ